MEALKKEVTTKNKSEQYISRYDLEKKVAQLRKEEVTEMNRNSLEGKTFVNVSSCIRIYLQIPF